MLWIGAVGLLALAVLNRQVVPDHGPLWRVLLAIAAFVYLWWLAALLFDLCFVWHRYVQGDVALRFLRERVQPRDFAKPADPRDEGTAGGGASAEIPPSTPPDPAASERTIPESARSTRPG